MLLDANGAMVQLEMDEDEAYEFAMRILETMRRMRYNMKTYRAIESAHYSIATPVSLRGSGGQFSPGGVKIVINGAN